MDKNNIISMIVEIPKGNSNKYEYNDTKKRIILDRVLYGANFFPGEYGFIENTLDWDGDPLDIISLITYPTIPGCEINVRILGAIKMIDDGQIDTKIIGVINVDPRWDNIQKLDDVPKHLLKEIKNFFLQYKILQKKTVIIKGFCNLEETLKEIQECKYRYIEYKNILEKKGKNKLIELWTTIYKK